MRDGKWIATEDIRNLTREKIVSLMVGRDLTNLFPSKGNIPGSEVLLSVRNLRGAYAPTIKDVSFDLHAGEILGVAGLVGSRRTEMVETIFGLRKIGSGDILLRGKRIESGGARRSIAHGFGLLTEERRRTGIFSELASIDSYCAAGGIVRNGRINKAAQWAISTLKVKTPSQRTLIGTLSGGNQQKVVLGRWLLTQSDVLMLDEPTKGIDVGAKYEIYGLMIDIAIQGKGIIFVSSEMPELLGVTDRILVMSDGRVSGIVNTRETTQEEILNLAAKFL